jgi:polyhydroxyalkanoate synthase
MTGAPRTPEQRRQGLVNLWDFLVHDGIADTSRTPGRVIAQGRTRSIVRYDPLDGVEPQGLPVLLVPPLGSQSLCFDLRQGCSFAGHLVGNGRPTYLVDYGRVGFADRGLGIEHWIDDVLPHAIQRVSEDNAGAPVNLVGWCLGGLMSLAAVAARPELPVNAVAMVASPFDFSVNPLTRPLQTVGRLTGGRVLGSVVRTAGHLPAGVVGAGFKATALPMYLRKPFTVWSRRDDREFLGQVQAVDKLMNNMAAYPGRATLQLYQKLALRNELASGKVQGLDRVIDLATVRVPVMNVAGASDVLASPAAVHHVGRLLPNSPDVRLPEAPGGHLGVLTGMRARATTWAYVDDFLDAHPAQGSPDSRR